MATQPPPPSSRRPLFRLLTQARLEPQQPGVSPLFGQVLVPMSTVPVPSQEQPRPEPTTQVLAQVVVPVPTVEALSQTLAAREPTPPPPPPVAAQPQPYPQTETPRRATQSPRTTAVPPQLSADSRQTASPRARESPREIKTINPTSPQSPKPSPRTQLMPYPEYEARRAEGQSKSIYMQEYQNKNHRGESYNHYRKGNNSNIQDSYYTTMIPESKEEKGDLTKVSTWNKPHNSASKTSSEDEGMRVITVAGKNMGALMELGHRQNRGRKLHENHLFHSSKHQTEEKEINGSKTEEHTKEAKGKGKVKSMSAIVNSNVQGVNNSLLLNSTCSHNSPGVHITPSGSRYHKPKP